MNNALVIADSHSVIVDNHSVIADGHSAFVVSLTTNDNTTKRFAYKK